MESLIPKSVRNNALWLLTFALLVTGCRKHPEPQSEAAPTIPRPTPVSVEQADSPPAPAPVVENPDAPVAAPTGQTEAPAAPRNALDLESLNTILDNYVAAYDRVPKTIDEMVRLKLIPRAPAAAPGKRYVIDTLRRQIREEKL